MSDQDAILFHTSIGTLLLQAWRDHAQRRHGLAQAMAYAMIEAQIATETEADAALDPTWKRLCDAEDQVGIAVAALWRADPSATSPTMIPFRCLENLISES